MGDGWRNIANTLTGNYVQGLRVATNRSVLLFRPSDRNGFAPLFAEFLLGQAGRPSLAALPAQRHRVRVLLCHSRIILRTVT